MLDYHMHLEKGELNRQWLDQFIIQARARGITRIGISEHAYLFQELLPIYRERIGPGHTVLGRRQHQWFYAKAGKWSLEDYFELLLPVREQGIKIGLELDWFPGSNEQVKELLAPWPWDYVIGSVHWLDGWVFDIWQDTWQGRNIGAVWDRYLEISRDGVTSGCFDILGHADAIKIFGQKPSPMPLKHFNQLARALAENSVAVEVNTAFNYRGHSSNYCPDPEVLELFGRHGVPLTFGSDAHYPQQAGQLLDHARMYAAKCGYTCYIGFEGRRPTTYEL